MAQNGKTFWQRAEAVRDHKGACQEALLICWSAFLDESGNFPLGTLMVYFEQGTSLYEQEQNTYGRTV
jgi:hypothetical protein